MRSKGNFFQLTLSVHDVFLKVTRKSKKSNSDFYWWTPPPRPPVPGGQDIKQSLIEPCVKVCQPMPKLSNEALLKSHFVKNS